MKRPNFFILGAPKCGTTSMAHWLSQHPQAFMSPEKEPHYFNTDDRRYLNSAAGYEALFAAAGDQHLAVGEASVWYLYSGTAVPGILDYAPAARFIVMLRNPVEMAPALHEELVFTGHENEANFAVAWALQEERAAGRRLPPLPWEPRRLLYGPACRLGEQMQRLYGHVDKARVLPILIDDVREDPARVWRAVQAFLGLPDDKRASFPVLNVAKTRRWPVLQQLSKVAIEIKSRLGIEGGLGLWRHVEAANRTERKREALAPETTAMLRAYFGPDVRRLGQLIGRDLSPWGCR